MMDPASGDFAALLVAFLAGSLFTFALGCILFALENRRDRREREQRIERQRFDYLAPPGPISRRTKQP